MNIAQVISAQPDAIGIFKLSDLKEFALELIAETERKTLERLQNEPKQSNRLFRADVVENYGVSLTTVNRWAKEGYIIPDGYIGKRPYYTSANIEKVIASKRPKQR